MNAEIYLPLFWTLFKLFLYVFLAVAAFGALVGLFTYKNPIKDKKIRNFIDFSIDFGLQLSYYLIGLLRTKLKGSAQAKWLSDNDLLAMLRGLKPKEFEYRMADMYQALGYKTKLVGGPNDGGVDIEMTKNGKTYVVQCKKFITRIVRPHDVRDFYGAMVDRNVSGKGIFITTNIFTTQAEKFAEGKSMELIDRSELVSLYRESGLMGKNIEKSQTQSSKCPRCGKPLVLRKNTKTGEEFWGCSGYPECLYTKGANLERDYF